MGIKTSTENSQVKYEEAEVDRLAMMHNYSNNEKNN